jgi:LemA protein
MTTGIGILIVLGIVVLFILWVIGVYNGLIVKRNQYRNAFSQIDVQLKRRYDLIPNLVETAKGYMKHEQETLEKVIQARNIASGAAQKVSADQTDPNAMKQLGSAEGTLTGALSRLMVVVEQYPDLKANQNMLALQEELTATENKVAFSRQAYNDSAMLYNNARETFPANLIAGMFNFLAAVSFEIENPQEKQAPKVQF